MDLWMHCYLYHSTVTVLAGIKSVTLGRQLLCPSSRKKKWRSVGRPGPVSGCRLLSAAPVIRTFLMAMLKPDRTRSPGGNPTCSRNQNTRSLGTSLKMIRLTLQRKEGHNFRWLAEAVMAVSTKSMAFWNVTPCNTVAGYKHFGGTTCFGLQDGRYTKQLLPKRRYQSTAHTELSGQLSQYCDYATG
jgi:hypothetical protein